MKKITKVGNWTNEPILLQGHSDQVISVALTPDKKMIASGSRDLNIRLWFVNGGKCIKILQGHQDWVIVVKFSPDQKYLASGSCDKRIFLWDISQLQITPKISPEQEVNTSRVTFSKDSKKILTCGRKDIFIWSLNFQLLQTLKGHMNLLNDVSEFHSNIVSCSRDKTIKLWKQHITVFGDKRSVTSIRFNQSGTLIASTGFEENIKIWSRQGKLLRKFKAFHNSWTLEFDKRYVYSTCDLRVEIFDVVYGSFVKYLNRTLPYYSSIAVCDQFIIAGGDDSSLCIWKK